MKTNMVSSNSMTFKGKIPKVQRTAIKTFTRQYLKEKNGYVGTNASFDNLLAAVSRGGIGLLYSDIVVENLPKLVQGDKHALSITILSGLGGLGVSWHRFKADKIATATAKLKLKPFVQTMIEKGYKSEEELRCGVEFFMGKSGGLCTSKIRNKLLPKRVDKLLKEAQMKLKKQEIPTMQVAQKPTYVSTRTTDF